jgi:hypothetical protein
MDRVNDVAKEVVCSRSAGMEGLIDNTDSLRVERYCRRADIVTADLEPDIPIAVGDEAVPGQYLPVVVENLIRSCTYRFLLAVELTVRSPNVSRLREMITDAVGGDTSHERCLFRTAVTPLASTTVLYDLDTSVFIAEEPALYTQFRAYLLDGNWLGYINRPNDDSTVDILMAPSYVKLARQAFEVLWSDAIT